MFRIPGPGKPVFLQHGLVDSSAAWLVAECLQAANLQSYKLEINKSLSCIKITVEV